MADASHSTYLIIGGGVFGASTAYHLAKAHPEATISLVDRSGPPCSLAASYDFNKIVRADYGEIFYCELALKAMEFWKTDPLYKEFFHQVGLVNIGGLALGRKIIENYKTLNVHCESEIISPEDLKKRYGGVFSDMDYRDVEEIFVNPLSGFAEATAALKKVTEAAMALGVKYIQGDIETLTFDDKGACTGVRAANGRILSATHTILSTGAGTEKLLADSAPNRPELHAEYRITASAVATAIVKLSPDEVLKFKDVPAFAHSVRHVNGETMPPTPEGYLKFIRDVSFKNTFKHSKSGVMLSAPPDLPNQAQHVVPKTLEDECLAVVKGIYGKRATNWKFDSFRICWDAFTPTQDFIIANHPHCENLIIATAGSFHGWKFLPILGDYVVKLLDGQLEEGLVKRWAWDRGDIGSAHGALVPQRELRDL